MQTRHLPKPSDGERVETGPVKFGDDWTGVFIRGDDCAYYALCLANLNQGDVLSEMAVEGLQSLLASSNEFGK